MALENAFSLFEDSRYEELFPNVRLLGNAVDYFIQCNTYEVLVPSQSTTAQHLDMFEDAVLRLLDYKPYTKQEMAATLCLPKDIISFIRIRLRELGLLEKDEFTVSELGKNYLGGLANKNSRVVYKQAKLFVIKDTGEILPYVHYGELEYANVKKSTKRITNIEYGSAGRPIIISGINIWSKTPQGALGGKMLKSSDIKDALFLYNKISNNSTRFAPVEILASYAIENTSAEDCLLHVKAAIQDGSTDELIVSDGFVANNDYLARYLRKEHPEIINDVKAQAAQVRSQESEEKSGFDFEQANEGRYRNLYQLMYSINAAYEKITAEESDSSQDEYVEEKYDQKQFLLNCYAVIEHILYNYLLKSPLRQDRLKLLYRQDTHLNQELILTLSEQLGLDYIRQYDYLFGIVSRNNITKMYNAKIPNMYIALPLVLIETFDNKDSLFREVLKQYPGVIHTINKLHNKCKDLRHKTYADDINVDYVDQIYYFTTLLIECLLPDFIFRGKEEMGTVTADVKQNQRLLADVNLAEVFGSMYYYNVMDEALKNEWKLVAPGKKNYPAPYEFVNTLYRILQETIYEQVFYMKKKQLSKEQLVELAQTRWGKPLERGLTGVHKYYLKDTLGSKNTTLGAQALVYLCFCPDEKLAALKEIKFDEIVSLVTKYREHGNNVALELDTRELEQLRDKVINVIKAIGAYKMDEKKIIEETTESKITPDAPVAEQSASIEESTQADSSDAANVTSSADNISDVKKTGNVVEEKSYKERVEELLKWQNRLADEQAKLEAYRTSIIFQQMGELEQKKKTALSEQQAEFQAELQAERQKFEADLAATKAKKDAETLAMIEREWIKFEKEKEAQIVALKKELEIMRSQTQKEMESLRTQVSKELDAARSQTTSEIQTMKSAARKEIEKEQADGKKALAVAKEEAIKATESEIEQRTRELIEGEERAKREAKRLAELENKLQQLEIELEAREAQVNDDKSKNARERRRLDREKQRISGANDNLEQEIQDRFSDRIDSYERKLGSKDEELERLRSELASLMATSESIQSLRVAYGMDPEKIKIRIADLEARNKALLDEAANSTTRIEYDRVCREKRALETKYAQAQEEIRRISVTDEEVQSLKSKIHRLETNNENLRVEAEEARNIQKSLQNELLRLSTPEERELDREARIESIKRQIMPIEELEWETYPVDMGEIEWLESVKRQCDKYGIRFHRRILYAFHTALKVNDWSIITVLAGVSGTGKSELPKLYSFFGGLNFISVAVQPNWDSQESMLGFFNSIDNQFQPEDLLSFLVQCSDKDSGFKNYTSVVLLDEMNLAYVEYYFAEFLSKLEERRGKTKKDLPKIKVNLGAGVAPYELPLVRNVLWTGTMNQDETTKSLSDKVIDRSMVINFPRPKHLAERTKMEKLKKTEKKLLYDTRRSWITVDLESDFSEEQRVIFKDYKRIIETINDHLEEVGRALGHRVWQSIEYYIANYPTVIMALKNSQGEVTEELKAEMRTAFEDQLVQKVMPKLRGIETRGKGRQSLQNIEDLLADEGFDNLKDDFEIACEQGYGQFVWSSAKYLGDDDENVSSEDNDEDASENETEE